MNSFDREGESLNVKAQQMRRRSKLKAEKKGSSNLLTCKRLCRFGHFGVTLCTLDICKWIIHQTYRVTLVQFTTLDWSFEFVCANICTVLKYL